MKDLQTKLTIVAYWVDLFQQTPNKYSYFCQLVKDGLKIQVVYMHKTKKNHLIHWADIQRVKLGAMPKYVQDMLNQATRDADVIIHNETKLRMEAIKRHA